MNTIFISVYPKPDGPNITQLCVDFNTFDPHEGVRFVVVMKNPAGIVIDKTYTNLAGEDWQDWPPAQTAGDDYNYVKKVVLDNLGYTEAIAPFFVNQPQNLNLNEGQSGSFISLVSGDAPITYQWSKNGIEISGANSNNYEIASASDSDIGTYLLTANNAVGKVNSSEAILTINKAPTISYQPQNVSGYIGGTAFFSVLAQGNPSPSYQWLKDGIDISGAESKMYSINSLQESDAGTYSVKVYNIAGNVLSDNAELQVSQEPQPSEPNPPVSSEIKP